MRSIKSKFFVFIFIVLTANVVFFYVFIDSWLSAKTEVLKKVVLDLDNVIVHLDLKGAPPRLKYLETLLPVFKDNGVTGVLMEYEDMFPYEGKLVNLSATNCYHKDQLKSHLIKAVAAGLEIIPLIQTFGHMEHVLKLPEFRHLREEPMYPDSICPSRDESTEVIREMLKQVIDFHNSVAPLKHIHIGCDEVYHINACSMCSLKRLDNKDIFLNHVNKITNIVKQLAPNAIVLMWDDMFREIKVPQWSSAKISNSIEPVYWDYDPSLAVSHVHLMKYHKKFNNVWIASAYKGADGITATIPNFKKRFDNHLSWMDFIIDYKFAGKNNVYHFKGIILTGWSRYSHMDPLCELLPASLPALVFNLILIGAVRTGKTLTNGKIESNKLVTAINEQVKNTFKCETEEHVDTDNNLACAFQCIELYSGLKQFLQIKKHIDGKISSEYESYSSIEFYSKLNRINMNNAVANLEWCTQTLKDLLDLERKLNNILYQYYEMDVIEEYLNYKILPIRAKLMNAQKMLRSYAISRSWERGPGQNNVTVDWKFLL